jgi:2,5-dihydroxypyridine 5,6-dioxygenase
VERPLFSGRSATSQRDSRFFETMTDPAPIDLVALFTRGLELSRVEVGETVAIYTEGGIRRSYAEAFAAAAESLGANAFVVNVPRPLASEVEGGGWSGKVGLGSRPVLVEAFKGCDLLIDLVMLLFRHEKIEIQQTGTRILTCAEPPDTIARLFPTAEHRRRARIGQELLARASTLRVTSDAGTDLTYELGQYAPFCQYGAADEPGRWDHFASAFVVTVGNDRGVNGEVVFDVDDIVTPPGYAFYVREPVRLTIEDGFIEGIEGGPEAVSIRDYLGRYDRRAYAVSHIGWGLNENARWDALRLNPDQIGLDPRSYLGCVMFSTGPNNEFGGSNDTTCHFDMPLRNCSLWVDDELIVDRGRMVEDSAALR